MTSIRVLSNAGSSEGCLVFSGERLAAVLVRVSQDDTGRSDGWFLEAGFGPCSALFVPPPPIFSDLPQAEAWLREQIDAALP